jgi:peptidoglycan/LPS O-acetylase OafA/YrhL
MLPLFFLLSGYVCATKPIRLANAGCAVEARRHIASSAIRRVIRLAIPATVGTILAWGVCQLRIFEVVPLVPLEGMWLATGTPAASEGIFQALYDLLVACVRYPN